MARRTIDLDERTVGVLESIRRPGSDDDRYVFRHEDGSPIHPQVLSDAFKRLVSRSGLPRIRLHDYADVRVMPMFPSTPSSPVVSARKLSA
jgi:hypothetical protein